jgi:2'-5' RNA ligase
MASGHDTLPAGSVRAFLALLLPEDLIAEAAGIEGQVQSLFPPGSVKWVDPSLFHLTVRFFGDLDRKQLEKASRVVQALDRSYPKVAVGIEGISAFPSPARPQTLWVSVHDRTGSLDRLAALIDRRIREAGFGPADKPWKSHLTIGRVRRERHLRIDPGWNRGLTWSVRDFTIGTVALMRSELRPEGPRYTPLIRATAA